MPPLSEAQTDIFLKRLQALRDELLALYESGRAAADTVVLDQTKVGRLSRMEAMQQQNMAQSSMRSIENRLRQVNRALARIESGDYGYCEACGEDIDAGRLEVSPEVSCCFACQSKQEYHPQS